MTQDQDRNKRNAQAFYDDYEGMEFFRFDDQGRIVPEQSNNDNTMF